MGVGWGAATGTTRYIHKLYPVLTEGKRQPTILKSMASSN
jgi:hypothetical protein